jgi:hypothetical protein
MSRRISKRRLLNAPLSGYHEDPLAAVANLFDLASVFIAFLVAVIATRLGLPELLNPEADVAVVRKSDSGQVEIVLRRGKTVKAYRATDYLVGGQATRLGIAYRLEDGQIVYVPDEFAGGKGGTGRGD